MQSEEEDDFAREKDAGERLVGRGLRGRDTNPEDPQWYLANSDHPYAPFPDNALKWESFVYDDGTSYEGLTLVNVPHNKGVMVFGSGTGAGIQSVKPFDKYEGEFFYGFANGLGSFISQSGETYRGEWSYGKRSGCGASINMGPYLREVRRGAKPAEAWEAAKREILADKMRYGLWDGDRLVQDSSKARDATCSVNDIRGVLQEMESVVTRARMFRHKPDGDVTFMKLLDKNGVPVPVFQDPLHYPHGTKFLAPGPVGQCHPVPDHPKLRTQMRKHARNYMRIYNQFNLPFFAKPGEDLFAAARLDAFQRMGAEVYARVAAGQEPEDAQRIVQDSFFRNEEPLEDKVQASKPKGRRPPPSRPPPPVNPPTPPPTRVPPPAEIDDDDELDEDDLIASTSSYDPPETVGGRSGSHPPSVFGHIGERSKNLTKLMQASASQVHRRILPRLMRRRPLGDG